MRSSDVHIIQRGRGRRSGGKRSGRRAAGALIAVLLLLSAIICMLVVFLPKIKTAEVSSSTGIGKTFYFLATGEQYDGRQQAVAAAAQVAERGGAGYVYNDGKYKIVAAVYDRESDVNTLVQVNADAYSFSLVFAEKELPQSDNDALGYLFGEWFKTVYNASSELERGNITEASAERAVRRVCDKLTDMSAACSPSLARAIGDCAYLDPQNRSVISYMRYISVKAVICVHDALNG